MVQLLWKHSSNLMIKDKLSNDKKICEENFKLGVMQFTLYVLFFFSSDNKECFSYVTTCYYTHLLGIK